MAMQQSPQGDEASEANGSQGASQMIADVNSGMMKLAELMSGQMPDEARKLGSIIQQFQDFISSLGQASPPQKAQGLTTPEAGTAQVQPVM